MHLKRPFYRARTPVEFNAEELIKDRRLRAPKERSNDMIFFRTSDEVRPNSEVLNQCVGEESTA